MKDIKKKISFFLVCYFLVNVNLTFAKSSKLENLKASFSSFIENLPNKAKNKIDSLNYDLEELDFVFSLNFLDKNFDLGFKWDWESGSGDVSSGFTGFRGDLISPTLGELGVLPSAVPSHISKVRLLNILLGIGTKTEQDIAKSEVIKNITTPLRKLIGDKFLNGLKSILVLEPIQVFYIKLILLSKTYLPNKRFDEFYNQMMFLLMRLMQTVNVSRTIEVNNGEKNPARWKTRVYYSDPKQLINKLPDFLKKYLKDIKAPVALDAYQNWQDKKAGINNYDKQISQTMKRANIDSEVKYAIENLSPLYNQIDPTLTDAKYIAYLCSDFFHNISKAKRNDTYKYMMEFIKKSIEAINKIEASSEMQDYKKTIISKLQKLMGDEKKVAQPLLDDFIIQGKKSIVIVQALDYYMYSLKNYMNYPFYGDKDYLYTDAKVGKGLALGYAKKIAFRVFKDSRKAFQLAKNLVPDIKVKDKEGEPVEIGKSSYEQAIGKAGVLDPKTGKIKEDGKGPLFVYQKANIDYKKAVNMLKVAKSRFGKDDKRVETYEKKKAEARKTLLNAKKNLVLIKNKFLIDVMRYFKFKRAEELEPEAVMDFLLREFKRLSIRSENLKPIIDNINNFFTSLLGFQIFDMQDLEKEPDFDEDALLEEEEFDYQDISGDELDLMTGFDADVF